MLRWWSGFGLGLLACSSPDGHLKSKAQPIIDGVPSELDSVVMIRDPAGLEPSCSGVQVAPGVVLTAQHCVTAEDGTLAEFRLVGFGDSEDTIEEIASTILIPFSDAPQATAVEQGADLALLMHDSAHAAITCIASEPPQDPTGLDVTLHGFGISDLVSAQSGSRLRGSGSVVEVEANTGRLIVRGDLACLGDSGGPVINRATDEIVGIMSEVSAPNNMPCSTGATFAIDLSRTDLAEFLMRHSPEAFCARTPTGGEGGFGGNADVVPRVGGGNGEDAEQGTGGQKSVDIDEGSSVNRLPREAGCGCQLPGHSGTTSHKFKGATALALALVSLNRRRRCRMMLRLPRSLKGRIGP